jgi:hypothetical protein
MRLKMTNQLSGAIVKSVDEFLGGNGRKWVKLTSVVLKVGVLAIRCTALGAGVLHRSTNFEDAKQKQ